MTGSFFVFDDVIVGPTNYGDSLSGGDFLRGCSAGRPWMPADGWQWNQDPAREGPKADAEL
ncbi:MAG TPA: hypothetical protein DCZ69_16830 [Syntrophobacteraceae bacterium]|nr:hypothetical protein [Syntrophobacteraceae bacterium]HBZ55984.1 hypothetical protein [Syntrophobacteraceae bacterium]